MSGPLRNKQGCWTCRLRKKKCDENAPQCVICTSLSITCYGYGPKPDWMDNGEKERAVANGIKQVVKYTSRRKITTHSTTKTKPAVKLAPKSSEDSTKASASSSESSHQDRQESVNPQSDYNSSQEYGTNIMQSEESDPSLPKNGHFQKFESISSISGEESTLLMHFLDNVFPHQYPMYKSDILNGGRGWLLTILLRTKPLYHAALALSSYHRRMMISAKLCPPCRVVSLVQQEKHLAICLTEFQETIKSVDQFVQMNRPNNELGTVTSIVQLVFFELFAGQGTAWQIHLRAATNMFHRGCADNLTSSGLAEKSKTILHQDLPLTGEGATISQEVMTFRFMGSTIIWLDIIASITAGTAPSTLPYHSVMLASESQTKLEEIMGCKNWAMLQIGRIAALHSYQNETMQLSQLGCSNFCQVADDIRKEIECALSQEALEGFNISESYFRDQRNDTTSITRLFAESAFIYLHLITYGFQMLETLETTISRAMTMLQIQRSNHLLQALVFPLYIIGCVARQGNEQKFFRSTFSSPPLLDPLLKHRGRILPILEEIWSRRQTMPGFAWSDTLELSHDLLVL